jgi:hypothetical protein
MRSRTAFVLGVLSLSLGVGASSGLSANASEVTPRHPTVRPNYGGTGGCNGQLLREAGIYTATNTVADSNGSPPSNAYNGWIGVDGAIETPPAAPNLNDGIDHNAGWLGVYWFTGSPQEWLQIGWFTGKISETTTSGCSSAQLSAHTCTQTSVGAYALYVEYQVGANDYYVNTLSSLSRGSDVIYRVAYDGGGCWSAFYNYTTPAGPEVCGLPDSGPMAVTNELYNQSGQGQMALGYFGYTDPSSNDALRLEGADGYVPWNSQLTAGKTAKTYIPSQFDVNFVDRFYYIDVGQF